MDKEQPEQHRKRKRNVRSSDNNHDNQELRITRLKRESSAPIKSEHAEEETTSVEEQFPRSNGTSVKEEENVNQGAEYIVEEKVTHCDSNIPPVRAVPPLVPLPSEREAGQSNVPPPAVPTASNPRPYLELYNQAMEDRRTAAIRETEAEMEATREGIIEKTFEVLGRERGDETIDQHWIQQERAKILDGRKGAGDVQGGQAVLDQLVKLENDLDREVTLFIGNSRKNTISRRQPPGQARPRKQKEDTEAMLARHEAWAKKWVLSRNM